MRPWLFGHIIVSVFAATAFADGPDAAPARTPTSHDPAQRSVPVKPVGQAVVLSTDTIDWGVVPNTASLERTVVIRNNLDTRVRFVPRASCGCTAVTVDRTILEPGMDSRLTVGFDTAGRAGPQLKHINIDIIEPAGYPTQVINISADILATLRFDPPRIVAADVDHRIGAMQTLTIFSEDPTFAVSGVETEHPFIRAHLRERVTATTDRLVHVPLEVVFGKGAPIGPLEGTLRIVTNDQKMPVREYRVTAEIVGDARVHPRKIAVRPRTPNTIFSAQVVLNSASGKPITVTGIDAEAASDMHLVPDIQPNPNGPGFVVSVSGNTPADQGMYSAALVITTTGAVDETIRVPIHIAVTRSR